MKRIIKSILKRYLYRVYNYFVILDSLKVAAEKKGFLSSFQSIGFGVKINGKNHIFSDPKKIILGNNVHIGSDAFFKSEGGLIIGDNTHISRRVTIYTENHNYESKALPYDNTTKYKPVLIGKNVWIGMNVSIIPGVEIGEGAIIGLGCIVNRNIKPYEIVGSSKVKQIKYRSSTHYKLLDKTKSYGGVNGKLMSMEETVKFPPSYQENRLKRIAFILGTGRSGTVSITNILNQHPDCKAFHEDIRQLIRLSTDLAYGKDATKTSNELNLIFETKIWNSAEKQLIVHSDQRLWNLVPFLSTFFPNSIFIHLERDATSCIKSMVLRDWYQSNEYPDCSKLDWAKYRLRGDMIPEGLSTDHWSKMSNVEKCTWYFSYVNKNISKNLEDLSDSRKLYIKLDELDERLSEILDFLDLKKLELKILNSNTLRKKDALKIKEIDQSKLLLEIENAIQLYNHD